MIPREIYTLGAVQFNTQPLARLQGELLAKKAAKEEALDKYFNDLKGKITSAGMRSVDVNGFNQKLNNWISEGIANKSEIAKGGIAYQKHLEGYNSLLNDAELSKQEQKKDDEIAKLRFEDKIDEDFDFPIIQKRSKSIYDPEFYKNYETRQPYNIGDFSVNIPTWNLGERKQFIDFALSGVTPAGKANLTTVEDKKNLTQTTTYDKVFTEDQKKDNAKKALAISSDQKGMKTYKQILKEGTLAKPTAQFTELAAAYNSIFPNDLMNTPQKVAAADIILNMSGVKMPATPVTTPLFKEREKFKSSLIEGRQKSTTGENLLTYDILGKYPSQEQVIVKKTGTPEEKIGKVQNIVFKKDIPSEDYLLITNKEQVSPIVGGGIDPYFIVRDDGNWEGAQGQVIDRTSVARANLDRTSLSEERRLSRITPSKAEKTINLSDVPTGAKLTQKGSDYYYQGKKVIQ